MDVDADAEAEADGDEINAAACGCSWGCTVNPIVADAAATTVALVTNDTSANVSNILVVTRMIFDALKLFIPLKNIVPTDIRSFLSPPAGERKKIQKKREREKTIQSEWNANNLNRNELKIALCQELENIRTNDNHLLFSGNEAEKYRVKWRRFF